MKKLLVLSFVMAFVAIALPCKAATFTDDFNDGNADGWNFVNPGWSVEDGALKQYGSGGALALFENGPFADQTVETDFKLGFPGWAAGLSLWYQGYQNRVEVNVLANWGTININEFKDVAETTRSYPVSGLTPNTWYKLKVVANSANGEIAVYLDNVHLFTDVVSTPNRSGYTGLIINDSYERGVYFDNFSLITSVCSNPEWTCSDWNICQPDGTQVRTCTVAPECASVATSTPAISQSCVYTPPQCTASDWQCSDWGVCKLNRTQTRTCSKTINCDGGVAQPAITKSCRPICTLLNIINLWRQENPRLPNYGILDQLLRACQAGR